MMNPEEWMKNIKVESGNRYFSILPNYLSLVVCCTLDERELKLLAVSFVAVGLDWISFSFRCTHFGFNARVNGLIH